MRDNLFNQVIKDNLSIDYQRHMTYEKVRLFDYALQFDIPRLSGVDIGIQAYRIVDGVITHYMDKDKVDDYIDAMISIFNSSKGIKMSSYVIDYINQSMLDIKKLGDLEIDTDADIDKLFATYKDFCAVERKLSLMNQLLFMQFEMIITRSLSNLPKKEIEILSKQIKITPLDSYKIDICNYLLGELSFSSLYERYKCLGMTDIDNKPRTKKEIEQDIYNVKNPKKTKESIEKKYNNIKFSIEKVINKYKSDKHTSALINYFRVYSDEKEWKNFFRERSTLKLRRLVKLLAKKLYVDFKTFSLLTLEERKKIIEGDRSVIKNLHENSLYLIYKKKFITITDTDKLNIFDNSINISGNFIKGNPVYLGKVKGRVCIVYSRKEFSKFKKGDVFVTPTTRPDFVPLLSKASAIVANEGGLLSHAAIISRELKKPCIIGTKNATQILKDGDMVEVDAHKGIIKILK